MQIRLVMPADLAGYMRFRCDMWPRSTIAGDWESLHDKYVLNPLAELCPGSGLYGCFVRERLVGVMGAYPMPVTHEGDLYPAHMLVDWGVIPEYQCSPVAGRLFAHCNELPGRKFGSIGTPDSQRLLVRRGKKLEATEALALVDLGQTALLKGLRLGGYARPSYAAAEPLVSSQAHRLTPDELRDLPAPSGPAGATFVQRDSSFWSAFVAAQCRTGGCAFRLESSGAQGVVYARLLQVGSRVRVMHLLDVGIEPASVASAKALARPFRALLKELRVGAVQAVLTDSLVESFLGGGGLFLRRSPTYWWALARPSDTFSAESARWALTLADRDGIWGAQPPAAPRDDTPTRSR